MICFACLRHGRSKPKLALREREPACVMNRLSNVDHVIASRCLTSSQSLEFRPTTSSQLARGPRARGSGARDPLCPGNATAPWTPLQCRGERARPEAGPSGASTAAQGRDSLRDSLGASRTPTPAPPPVPEPESEGGEGDAKRLKTE